MVTSVVGSHRLLKRRLRRNECGAGGRAIEK
jgi:hypothetical protein